jgi:hypothetical protein
MKNWLESTTKWRMERICQNFFGDIVESCPELEVKLSEKEIEAGLQISTEMHSLKESFCQLT